MKKIIFPLAFGCIFSYSVFAAEPTDNERMTNSVIGLFSAYMISYELKNDPECKAFKYPDLDYKGYINSFPDSELKPGDRARFNNELPQTLAGVLKAKLPNGKAVSKDAYEVVKKSLSPLNFSGKVLCDQLNQTAVNILQRQKDSMRLVGKASEVDANPFKGDLAEFLGGSVWRVKESTISFSGRPDKKQSPDCEANFMRSEYISICQTSEGEVSSAYDLDCKKVASNKLACESVLNFSSKGLPLGSRSKIEYIKILDTVTSTAYPSQSGENPPTKVVTVYSLRKK